MIRYTAISALLSLLLFTSCSKSHSIDYISDTEKKIQGEWLVTEDKIVYYDDNNKVVNEEDLDVGNIWKINNGIITAVGYGSNVGATYDITGAKTMTFYEGSDTDKIDITVLTDSILELSVTDTSQYSFGTPPVYSNHNVITISFKRTSAATVQATNYKAVNLFGRINKSFFYPLDSQHAK